MIKNRIHYAWIIMIICCLAIFGSGAQMISQSVFLIPVREALHVNTATLSTIMMTPHTIGILLTPIYAQIFANRNLKYLLLWLLSAQAVSLILFSVSTSLLCTSIASVFFGLVFGSFSGLLPTLVVKRWFKDRGHFVLSIMITSSTLGGTVFSPLASWIIFQYGYQTAYRVLAAYIVFVVVPLVLLFIKDKPSDLNLKPFEDPRFSENPEKRTAVYGKDINASSAFKNPIFYLVILYYTFLEFGGYMDQHIVNLAVSIGYSQMQGAVIVSICFIGGVLARVILSIMNDRIGIRNTTIISSGLGIITSLAIVHFGGLSLNLYYVISFFYGMAIKSGKVQASSMCYSIFGASDDYSKIYANISLIQGLTVAIKSALIGTIYDRTGNYDLVLYFCALLYGISILLAYVLDKNKSRYGNY